MIVDRRDGDDDRPGGNVGRQEGDATRRTSKRNMQSTGTPAKKKTKGKTAETPTGPKRNDGNDDNVISQGGATDEKDADDGISAEINSFFTANDSVSKPGFSYPVRSGLVRSSPVRRLYLLSSHVGRLYLLSSHVGLIV